MHVTASAARSAAWIAAQYLSMNDSFVVFGLPEDRTVLSTTISVEIDPQTAVLDMDAVPSGLELVIYGEAQTTPFGREAILGATTTVSAPTPQILEGINYEFLGWSDGLDRSHSIVISSSPPPLIATFVSIDLPAFIDCLDGPGSTPLVTPPITAMQCLKAFDNDLDMNVDLADFQDFQVNAAAIAQ